MRLCYKATSFNSGRLIILLMEVVMFFGFECSICGFWSFDGDTRACICLKCIDELSEWGDPDYDK